jgi:hypothetical protein
MAFGTIDDKLWRHDKFMVPGGDAALGVLVRAISYSNDKGTDGFISTAASKMLSANTPAAVKTLRDIGSLEPAPGGYMIHNFTKDRRNLTVQQLAEYHEGKVESGRLGGKQAVKSGGTERAREAKKAKRLLKESLSTSLSTRSETRPEFSEPVTPLPRNPVGSGYEVTEPSLAPMEGAFPDVD